MRAKHAEERKNPGEKRKKSRLRRDAPEGGGRKGRVDKVHAVRVHAPERGARETVGVSPLFRISPLANHILIGC